MRVPLSLHTYRVYRLYDTHNTCVCVTSLFFVLLLVINCAALDHPKKGFVSSSSTVEGGTATYSCKPGFVLEGEDTRTCTSAGNWSGTEPTCRSTYCVHEAVRFSCNCVMVLVLQRTTHNCNMTQDGVTKHAIKQLYNGTTPYGRVF